MGYDSEDSFALAGMDDRDGSLDGGIKSSLNLQWMYVSLVAVTDLLGEHEGQEISTVLSKKLYEGILTPRIGFKWLSEDLVDHYYGVKSSEATGSRPAYAGDSTVNFLAGVSVGVPISEKWAIIGDFEYENLGSEIEDSPIIDREDIFTYVLGAVYRF